MDNEKFQEPSAKVEEEKVQLSQEISDVTIASTLLNIEDGNAIGSIRGINTAGGYTMGGNALALGTYTKASGSSSFAEGQYTEATGDRSHAEGYSNKAIGNASHAEGSTNEASGSCSHAEGTLTKSTGLFSHAEGGGSESRGNNSHAEGSGCISIGNASHAAGSSTTAQNDNQTAIGKFNRLSSTSNNGLQTDDALIIGNGISTRANAFRFTYEGKAYGKNWYTSGADYAEMFQWKDGNKNNEDRIGYFVALDGKYIRKATSKDKYILGIISTTSGIIGNEHGNEWSNMYVVDEWNRTQYEWIEVTEKEITIVDGKPVEIEVVRKYYVPKINPLYDPNKEYIPRTERSEWGTVGLLGMILVRDDGTCVANGYCESNNNGIATASNHGYRVLERTGKNQILVLFR